MDEAQNGDGIQTVADTTRIRSHSHLAYLEDGIASRSFVEHEHDAGWCCGCSPRGSLSPVDGVSDVIIYAGGSLVHALFDHFSRMETSGPVGWDAAKTNGSTCSRARSERNGRSATTVLVICDNHKNAAKRK